MNARNRCCLSLVLTALAIAAIPASARAAAQSGDLTGPWVLFADDHAVAKKEGVTRTYHAFEKHPENPLLTADKPWEGSTVYLYGTVLPGEDGSGYRMWYHAWADREYRMLYATSEDGLHWVKPALGAVAHAGSTDNNILFQRTPMNHSPQVIHTPWDADPARRYKMVYFDYGRTPPDFTVTGYRGMVSPDGIRWTDAVDRPILLDSPGDVGNFVWDPHTERYVGWPKKFAEVRGFRRRSIGFSATENFNTWPETTLVLTPDEFDDRWITDASPDGAHTDFYGMCGFAYESMYLGFLWMFPITDGKNDGPIFVELVTSHDGVHWERQEKPRPPVLPLGPEGAWDAGMIFTPNHPLVEDRKIVLYYGGFDRTHGEKEGGAAVGLATLRKDGFASLDAGEEPGTITTKPMRLLAGPIRVNYRAEHGWVKVEVLDEAGKALPGFGREEAPVLTGDSLDAEVEWRDGTALPVDEGAVRLRFTLKNASLYSFVAGDSAPRVLD